MNTTQLKYFMELARQLNYSTTAQQLYITQPTLSRSIMALEHEVGAKLFYRESGNVSLTPAGKLLVQEIGPLTVRYDGILQRVRNLGTGLAGELHIALSSEQQMPDTLLRMVKAFSTDCPNVEFQFSRMSTGEMMTALREETVDVSVGLEFVGHEKMDMAPQFQYILMEKEPPCLVRSAIMGSGTHMTVTTEECCRILSEKKLIFPSPKGMGDSAADPVEPLRDMLHLPQLMPRVQYVRDANAVSLYVAAGAGVTIVNRSHSITKENGIDVLEILGAEPYRKVLRYRGDSRNPILARFLKFISSKFAGQQR